MADQAISLSPVKTLSRRAQYELMRSALVAERKASFDSHWQELSNFIFPRRTRFITSDRNRGDKRNQNIIDSTGRFAARTLQSGLHAGLTSPARPWMRLTTPDPDLAEHGPVKEWLHQVTQRMLTIFLQSNLYNALPIVYGDMGTFATGAMAILEDTRDLFRAYTYPLGSYALGVDERGNATTFVREFQMTVRNVVASFGGADGQPMARKGDQPDWSRISLLVRDQYNRGNYESAVDVVWVVRPNDEYRADRLGSKYLPWASCYYERDVAGSTQTEDGKMLRESGFRTFPVMCPRWDVGSAEDAYGIDCPGMTALGDIKQLQVMQRNKGKAIAKQIDPPLVGPSSLKTQKTSLVAGDITFLDTREGQQGLKSIHDVVIDLADMTADIGQTQYRVQRAYYEDLFLMLANSDPMRGSGQITAREVEERHEEKLLALGPVLERTNDELLDPLVDRVYAMMEAKGLIPPPPDELDGVALKVEYISILAQAQKLVGVVGQDRFVQSIMPLVEAGLVSRHKLRGHQIANNYGDMLGVDPRLLRSDDEADALDQQDAQQAQAAAAAEQAKTLGQAVHSAGTTPMDQGDTALTRLVQGVAG